MKKALIGFLAAAAIACAPAVMAESTPAVIVDGSPIVFADQAPVIQNDRTLVPARGVFEAMEATVEWDADKRMVNVTSSDNVTIVRLYIDNPVMEVYKFEGSLFNLTKKDVTLEAAPQIMNDRTMLPLRAISEALKADVQWDENTFTASITSGRKLLTASETTGVSLSADTDTVNAGETFNLYLNASNLAAYPDTYVSTAMASVEYDKTNFEFVEAKMVNGDNEIEGSLGVSNPGYPKNGVKCVFVMPTGDTAAKTDGKLLKITMRSITGKEGSFRLANGFFTFNKSYDTGLVLTSNNDSEDVTYVEGPTLVIDQTPVVINAGK